MALRQLRRGGVILAAGQSSRMGSIKQLLPWKNTTLLLSAIHEALASNVEKVGVVLGANHEIISKHIGALPVTIIVNQNFERGQGSTVKCGADWAIQNQLDGILFMLCDHPNVTHIELRAILSKADAGHVLIASKYEGVSGVPAYFDKSYYPKLLKIPDESGAKTLLFSEGENIEEIAFPGKLADLDCPEEYESARATQIRQMGHF